MGEWMSLPESDWMLFSRIHRGMKIREKSITGHEFGSRYGWSNSADHCVADLAVEYDRTESYYNLVDVMHYERWFQ